MGVSPLRGAGTSAISPRSLRSLWGFRSAPSVDAEGAVHPSAILAVPFLALTGFRCAELIGHMSKNRRGGREGLRWGREEAPVVSWILTHPAVEVPTDLPRKIPPNAGLDQFRNA